MRAKVRRTWEWDQEIYSQLETAAEEDKRTVASEVLYIVEEFLKQRKEKGNQK
jgi:hypothetical protein